MTVFQYDSRLYNKDLAPVTEQKWGTYNYIAVWMTDVHSVAGYTTAGSLFALGLRSWQVFIALILGIILVNVFCNLIAKPSQLAGVSFPVMCRSVYGIKGANIPAVIRGCIAVAWYGIQTYLASGSITLLFIKFFPRLIPLNDLHMYDWLGLSALGWISFGIMWILQTVIFWNGMEVIRRFIDFCGPAVYIVMLLLCCYLIHKTGFHAINFHLSSTHTSASFLTFCGAIAIIVSYFSGPTSNFGDFARFAKNPHVIKKGNFIGLPLNFVFFSLLVVITSSLTIPVYGTLLSDPVQIVSHIDNTTALALGALTIAIATVGINIIANFISPAFDFSHLNPGKISWRLGGMIAAILSILITPWNLYSNPLAIHYTLDTLGACIGPIFGVIMASFYTEHKSSISVDDLYTMHPQGKYWYTHGYNSLAIWATVIGAILAIIPVLGAGKIPAMSTLQEFSWFIGALGGYISYRLIISIRKSTLSLESV